MSRYALVSLDPNPVCGLSFTPIPSGARRQLGESGTRPSQYGHVTVRAHRYVMSTRSGNPLCSNQFPSRASTSLRQSLAMVSNSVLSVTRV